MAMTKSEFEKAVNRSVSELYWSAVNNVQKYHPVITSLKDEDANMMLEHLDYLGIMYDLNTYACVVKAMYENHLRLTNELEKAEQQISDINAKWSAKARG